MIFDFKKGDPSFNCVKKKQAPVGSFLMSFKLKKTECEKLMENSPLFFTFTEGKGEESKRF